MCKNFIRGIAGVALLMGVARHQVSAWSLGDIGVSVVDIAGQVQKQMICKAVLEVGYKA